MDHLKKLETEGITISLDNVNITFQGSLLVMLGDSFGSHDIGSFCTNFGSSEYCCRFCEITKTEFRNNILEMKELRTVESYKQCVLEVERTGRKVRGIQFDSVLNELIHYHVGKPGGLPPCIGHDLFEGIVAYDLRLMIIYFIRNKSFRLGLLNFRLNYTKLFKEINKFIPAIKQRSTTGKLSGSAAEIRRLLLIFPLANETGKFQNSIPARSSWIAASFYMRRHA